MPWGLLLARLMDSALIALAFACWSAKRKEGAASATLK